MNIDIQYSTFLRNKDQLQEKIENMKKIWNLFDSYNQFMFSFQMKTIWLAAVLGLIACTDAFAVWRNNVMHKRARIRDPNWQPCLQICIYGCEVYEDFHLKYCATECIKFANVIGIGNFEPNRYCFDFSQWTFHWMGCDSADSSDFLWRLPTVDGVCPYFEARSCAFILTC